MWIYEKRLQFPVNIKEPNAKLAQFIMSQYGGPDGEMGASMRYLSQRCAMPYKEGKAVLTVITDLHEDMAAEQKARSTYDNILRVVTDYDVCEPIKFLREREIVHYQRFGEAKSTYTSKKIKELFLEISVVLFSIRFSFCLIRCSR